jgi:uncharacterized membrane protein
LTSTAPLNPQGDTGLPLNPQGDTGLPRRSPQGEGGTNRRGYLDWLRGIGVLIMIEAHTLDSWTHVGDRIRPSYRWAIFVGGFGAPIFLFLAGVAMALAANARTRRGMHETEAGRRAIRRAWQVFAFAFLFRLQSVVISGGGLRAFLKVDILNVMGVSLIVAAALWCLGRSNRTRVLLLAAALVSTAMVTPPVRSTPLLDWLPSAIEAYLRPEVGRSTFTLFPWAGFVFAGVLAGMCLDAGDRSLERRQVMALSAAGLAIAAAGYAASYLPAVYEQTSYWTSSPTFFFVRVGILAALVGVAFAWSRFWAGRWSPLQEFGKASLFVYWIHVEMVYGVLTGPIHRALTFEQATAAMLAFSLFLFGLVRVKNHVTGDGRAAQKSTEIGSFGAPAVPDRTHSS